MKVMMIDPWGINNISMYTNGICSGVSNYTDLTLFTNYHFKKSTSAEYEVRTIFFKKSEEMKRGKIRSIVRGLEYIESYMKIINELKNESYDVVHIQWLLSYKVDLLFLKKIKKYCNRIIYTAHNVIPHINGEKYISDLAKIYEIFDTIILHGDKIRDDFNVIFPQFNEKIYIQNHGTYLNQKTSFNSKYIDLEITKKIEGYNNVFIFFGNMFYNKGVDRLAKIWMSNFSNAEHLLIIAGRKNPEYKELDEIEGKIRSCNNILYIDEYVEENLLNYMVNKSDLIILPYRHASMSGVVFTAAEFKKPVLCTNIGALTEYIIDDENSYVVESDDSSLLNMMSYIIKSVTKEKLKFMGEKLHNHITDNYSWENISIALVRDCYEINN